MQVSRQRSRRHPQRARSRTRRSISRGSSYARCAGALGCALSIAGCSEWSAPGDDVPVQRGLDAVRAAPTDTPDSTDPAGSSAASWDRLLASGAGSSTASAGVASNAAGHAFITGTTTGALDGANQGSTDAFIAKYSTAGDAEWTRQLGTTEADASNGVAVDAAGHVLIAGSTAGALAGSAAGFEDAFVARYSCEGALQWIRQLGTSEPDAAMGVSADAAGNVYIAGPTRGSFGAARSGSDQDAFVAKYSTSGDLLWSRQLASSVGYDDIAAGVSADAAGDVFVAGRTFGGLDGTNSGSADAFVAKYSTAGDLLWVHQLGGADYDTADAVSADPSGNVFISGAWGGFLVGGPGVVIPGKPFVAKYSAGGDLLWQGELDDAAPGSAASVSAASNGHAFVAGYTSGAVAEPNQGLYDAFVVEFDADGKRLGALQLGGAEKDSATGVSASSAGALFIAHDTTSSDGVDESFLSRRTSDQVPPR
jgi:hypothetical protein